MYYMRTRDDLEIDLVVDLGGKLHLFEIKSSMTITDRHASSLVKIKNNLGLLVKSSSVISMAKDSFPINKVAQNYNWSRALSL